MGIVSSDRLIRQMAGYNPWWRGSGEAPPPFRRIAFYQCLQALREPGNRRAVMLSGPRRVGKSVILTQLVQELMAQGVPPTAILYLDLGDNVLKLTPLRDLVDLYHQTQQAEGSPTYLLLDEVHYARDWETDLKTIVDHRPWCRVLATGSAALEQQSAGVHAGVGRWETVYIPPLSFYEYLALRGKLPGGGVGLPARVLALRGASAGEFAAVALACRPVMPEFLRYLVVGGFPETAQSDDVWRSQKLLREDVVDRVLKRDIVTLMGVRSVAELERLFLYLCHHTGGRVNVSTCAGELGVTRQTVNAHLEALERAHLVYRLDHDAREGKKLLKARPKYYLVDAGLRNAVLLNGMEIASDAVEMGRIVETTVMRHLYAAYFGRPFRIGYWDEASSGAEVDLVLRVGGGAAQTVPIEVKYRERAAVDARSGLARFCAQEPRATPVVITKLDDDFGVEPIPGAGVEALRVPAHIFCLLMGRSERQTAGAA